MNLVAQETSLVIAGAWNPAILTPAWLFQHGMRYSEQEAHAQMVQVLIPAGPNGSMDVPRFSFPGFTFTARPDALIFNPTASDDDSLVSVQAVAARILEQLVHTPIGGIGHNFEFRKSDPNAAEMDIFGRAQADLVDVLGDGQITTSTVATSFIRGTVQINTQRQLLSGGPLVMKFNFHHSISSAQAALDVLNARNAPSFQENRAEAERIVKALHGEEQ